MSNLLAHYRHYLLPKHIMIKFKKKNKLGIIACKLKLFDK